MRAAFTWALLLMLAACAARAAVPASGAAEHAAASGDYRTAAQNYEQVLAARGFSAPVLFNLGNAWLRLGQPARAILEYERALVLAPGSAAIAANLAAAQQRAGLTPAVVGPWVAAVRNFSFDTYAWTGLASIWVLCAGVILLYVNGVARRFARLLILVAAVTLCVTADAAALCWSDLYRAVVQEPTALHLAPAASAAASGNLREGEVVWIQDKFGGFELVRTADGHSGWVNDSAAVPIRVSHP
ncbi:MAG TPA: tetratricopeptide repeat protein [Steroidobacteraceae bacterium]|nr:tetratricopeptide repeat protein [Steroidobacteraceae bacterium]